jgi:hypothetical protein
MIYAFIAGAPLPLTSSGRPVVEPASTLSPAGPTASFPNAYALLIGIGVYYHMRPLAKTTTDAHDLHDLFLQSGYPAANLALLLDGQATKAAISDKLDWLACLPAAMIPFWRRW